MSNSDANKNWEHEPGAPKGKASSAFLETPAELLERGAENYDTLSKSVFMAQMDTKNTNDEAKCL